MPSHQSSPRPGCLRHVNVRRFPQNRRILRGGAAVRDSPCVNSPQTRPRFWVLEAGTSEMCYEIGWAPLRNDLQIFPMKQHPPKQPTAPFSQTSHGHVRYFPRNRRTPRSRRLSKIPPAQTPLDVGNDPECSRREHQRFSTKSRDPDRG